MLVSRRRAHRPADSETAARNFWSRAIRSKQTIERQSLAPGIFVKGLLCHAPDHIPLLCKTHLPSILVGERSQNLRCDCILFFRWKSTYFFQGFFQQRTHTLSLLDLSRPLQPIETIATNMSLHKFSRAQTLYCALVDFTLSPYSSAWIANCTRSSPIRKCGRLHCTRMREGILPEGSFKKKRA